ncbi:MAG: hypothetical protein ACLFNU_02060 [Bacteroidales bacterium]
MFKLVTFFAFISIVSTCFASESNVDNLQNREDSIQSLLNEIIKTESVSKKLKLNEELVSTFQECLQIEESFDYPFDKLENIGKLKSNDDKLRVFTWNIPLQNGAQKYFGFIQIKHQGSINVFTLNDERDSIENPQNDIISHEKWYGALYYNLHEVEANNNTFYTLLGVDLNDFLSTKRVIEALHINHNGEPVFGYPLFRVRNKVINRIIFEYSSKANLVLKWDERHDMIVFNHLSPLQPSFKGNFQYYVPDLSFDGFRFEENQWVYIADIDIRNPQRDRPPAPVEPPEEDFEPGFLYRAGGKTQNESETENNR